MSDVEHMRHDIVSRMNMVYLEQGFPTDPQQGYATCLAMLDRVLDDIPTLLFVIKAGDHCPRLEEQ